MNVLTRCLVAGGILVGIGDVVGDEQRVPLRINAGGGDLDGWVSDAAFAEGGASFTFRGPQRVDGVEGAAPAAIYDTVRHREHAYRVPVANGKYRVRFHFTDGMSSQGRKMDYTVEGVRVISGYSPEDAGGGVNRASVVEVVTEVVDGELRIECKEGKGNDVFEAGVEILAAGDGDVVTAGPVEVRNRVPADGGRTAEVVARELREMAGGPVRLVWLRGKEAEQYTYSKSEVKLMVFDTEDGLGERELLSEDGAYSKPLITPDGSGVVFSERRKKRMHYVAWEGGEVRELGKGFVSDVWRDPSTGVDWAYARGGDGRKEDEIVRFPLEDVEKVEKVWDRTQNGHDGLPWFQLSADGKRFSDAFPWSKCGVGELESAGAKGKDWQHYGGGCWPGMAPDNSHRFWYFNGSHTEVTFFEPGAKKERNIVFNGMEGMDRQKVYHPRWSNEVRFVTVTGPENNKRSNLFFGKFNADFTGMEGWVQVTKSDRADIFGDAWIDSEGVVAVAPEAVEEEIPADPEAAWPGNREGLVFLWEGSNAKNEVEVGEGKVAACDVTLRGGAVPTRDFGMDLTGGWAEVEPERSANVFDQCQGTGAFTVEALVTPGNANQGGPARIVSLSSGTTERNFTLGQEGGKLVFRLRTPGSDGNGVEFEFGELQAGMARHVLVSFAAGRCDFYLDGKLAGSEAVGGDLSAWKPGMALVFGDEVGGGRNWDGRLEAVSIRARGVTAEEAAGIANGSWARLARREVPERVRVEAELVEVSEVPTLEEMGTYRRALAENTYEVKGGGLGGRIVVLEWVVLDREAVAEVKELGKVYGLTLEPVDAHPELDEEFTNVGLEIAADKYYRVDR